MLISFMLIKKECIYKAYIGVYLDYGYIIYNQAYKGSLHQKLDSVQYNAALAIAGALKGASTENFLSGTRLRISSKATLA